MHIRIVWLHYIPCIFLCPASVVVANSHVFRASCGHSAVEFSDILELVYLSTGSIAPCLSTRTRVVASTCIFDNWLLIWPIRLVLYFIFELSVMVEFEVRLWGSISVLLFDIVCIKCIHLIHVNIRVGWLHVIPAFLSSRTSIMVTNGHDLRSCCSNCIVEFANVLQFDYFTIAWRICTSCACGTSATIMLW